MKKSEVEGFKRKYDKFFYLIFVHETKSMNEHKNTIKVA